MSRTGSSPGDRAFPLETASDDILVQRAVDGDAAAFRVLLTRHAPLLRAYVRRITRSIADADDVVQETFIVAWKHLPNLREPGHVRAWLMRIASRKALARLRQRPTDVALADEVPAPPETDPASAAVRSAQLRELGRALDALPEDQRRCWLLREAAELSYEEIAAAMDLTPGQVRGRLARARANLTIRMEHWR